LWFSICVSHTDRGPRILRAHVVCLWQGILCTCRMSCTARYCALMLSALHTCDEKCLSCDECALILPASKVSCLSFPALPLLALKPTVSCLQLGSTGSKVTSAARHSWSADPTFVSTSTEGDPPALLQHINGNNLRAGPGGDCQPFMQKLQGSDFAGTRCQSRHPASVSRTTSLDSKPTFFFPLGLV
jgi:hypothetical protein